MIDTEYLIQFSPISITISIYLCIERGRKGWEEAGGKRERKGDRLLLSFLFL